MHFVYGKTIRGQSTNQAERPTLDIFWMKVGSLEDSNESDVSDPAYARGYGAASRTQTSGSF
jgi:hypothetical protein